MAASSRSVTSNRHDGLSNDSRIGQVGRSTMAEIMESVTMEPALLAHVMATEILGRGAFFQNKSEVWTGGMLIF